MSYFVDGKERFTLAERYDFHKKRFETGKVVDRNGEVHTLGEVARAREGMIAVKLLNRINRRSYSHYIDNKYIDGKQSAKKTIKKNK